jgi:hypothetical protein
VAPAFKAVNRLPSRDSIVVSKSHLPPSMLGVIVILPPVNILPSEGEAESDKAGSM